MSVFQVKLQNGAEGRLDVASATGLPMTTSIQRDITVQGPNGVHKKFIDGETFTGPNYWKQFDFIETLTDDGTTWSYVDSENTYMVVFHPGDDGVIAAGDDEDDDNMSLDIVAVHGGPAKMIQFVNTDSTHDVKVIINGSDDAIFTLSAGDRMIFNEGDITVSSFAFDNSFSGNAEVDAVEVIMSVKVASDL